MYKMTQSVFAKQVKQPLLSTQEFKHLPIVYNPPTGEIFPRGKGGKQVQNTTKFQFRKKHAFPVKHRMQYYQHPFQPIQTHHSFNRQFIKIPGRLRRDMHRHF